MHSTFRYRLIWGLLLFFFPILLEAQVCDGVPGDTIVLLTFDSGNNPGPALPPGTTTYTFGSIGGGNYLVTNTSGVNGGLWHHAPDHTEDTNGYMLLFDASGSPGIFFYSTVFDLCPNTTYEFGCWATNIVQPHACGGNSIQPNLTFEIRHPVTEELLATVSTGPIPTSSVSVWDYYGVTFDLPPDLYFVNVIIINNAPGGCGNDLAIDDITFRICNPFLKQEKKICDGDSIVVGTSVYTQPGTYRDEIKLVGTCNDSVVFTVVEKGDFIEQQQLYTLCAGESVVVDGQTYDTPGIFTDTLPANPNALCDTLLQIEIQVLEIVRDTQYLGFCYGEAFVINGDVLQQAGTYVDTIEWASCTKILVSIVTENPLPEVARLYTFCNGDALLVDGILYPQTGVYRDTVAYPGCDTVVVLTIQEAPHSFFEQQLLLCEGMAVQVGDNTYQTDGNYVDTLTNHWGCDSIVYSNLRFNNLSLSVSPDRITLEMGESMMLNGVLEALYPPSPLWYWSPSEALSCSDCPNPLLTAASSGWLTLFVEDTLSGCTTKDSIYLSVLPCKRIYIPNVFQPGTDNENGGFTLYAAACVRQIQKLHIYDRWGDLLFEARNFPPNAAQYGWKGSFGNQKPAPTGVYAYVFWVELFNGESQMLFGDVSLVR
jgi:hypothetical protein